MCPSQGGEWGSGEAVCAVCLRCPPPQPPRATDPPRRACTYWHADRPGHRTCPLTPLSALTGTLAASEDDTANSTLNVFTVASGHMHERLQKIMILSVIKNTKSHVQFWWAMSGFAVSRT